MTEGPEELTLPGIFNRIKGMVEVVVNKHRLSEQWEEESGPAWLWFVYTKPTKLTIGFGGCWFPGEFYTVPVRLK